MMLWSGLRLHQVLWLVFLVEPGDVGLGDILVPLVLFSYIGRVTLLWTSHAMDCSS